VSPPRSLSQSPNWPPEAEQRFQEIKQALSSGPGRCQAEAERTGPRAQLRTLLYHPQGDGIIFLRSTRPFSLPLVDQWESLRGLVCHRPLVPRLIIAASGFGADLRAERRWDLVSLLAGAREPWCRWIGVTDLDRLSEAAVPQLVGLLGLFAVKVYCQDFISNPWPAICQRCRSWRADVETIGRQALCTSCRPHLESRQIINDLHRLYVEEAEPVPNDVF
jgi:hypothetical protein